MYAQDFDQFRKVMDTLSEVFAKPKLSDEALGAYWEALKDQHVLAVDRAAKNHARYGKFFPKPAELRPKTEKAPEPQDDKAIAEADEHCVKNWEKLRAENPKKFWREFAVAYIGRLRFRYRPESFEYRNSLEHCLSRCNAELQSLGERPILQTEIEVGPMYSNPSLVAPPKRAVLDDFSFN